MREGGEKSIIRPRPLWCSLVPSLPPSLLPSLPFKSWQRTAFVHSSRRTAGAGAQDSPRVGAREIVEEEEEEEEETAGWASSTLVVI